MDDEALSEAIRGAQGGDSASYERIVERYAGRVFGFLLRMTGSRHDAEDLLQEVFVRLVRTLGAYKHEGRFEAWLFRVAANLVRDRVRRGKRVPKQIGRGSTEEASGADLLDETEGPVEPADAAMVRGEEIDALSAALMKLSDAEREAIMLRHFSHMSFKDIAEATGVPLGTALARAHRGLAHLREMLGG
ncbi:MAG: sigma-70 family RNA polymerase sigma factor [Planctomycetota bacterium]